MLLDRFPGGNTDSASAAPAAPTARTAADVYKSFGLAFRRLIDECVEMNITPTDVNRNLSAAAQIPPQFVPAIVQQIAAGQMRAEARRANPAPDVNLDRLGGGSGDPSNDYARRRVAEVKKSLE
jgi:hypothetical protein